VLFDEKHVSARTLLFGELTCALPAEVCLLAGASDVSDLVFVLLPSALYEVSETALYAVAT